MYVRLAHMSMTLEFYVIRAHIYWMDERTANLLGALSLAAADRIAAAAEEAIEHSGASPGAIVVLAMEPGMSNERLRSILKLSHPGCVRLIDRLVEDGLVERRAADDGRAVALYLTRRGQGRRRTLLKRREEVLAPIMNPLSSDEQSMLGSLLYKMLAALPSTEIEKFTICRLCNEATCDECPLPCIANLGSSPG